MADGLINCKKCGALFFKNSGRDICEECFKKELNVIESIKDFVIKSGRSDVTIGEISAGTGVPTNELEDMVSRGRLFVILPRMSIKCRFCGIELKDDEKSGFTCKKCLIKFAPKTNELEKKHANKKYEDGAKTLKRRLRGGMNTVNDGQSRYGFIQNYDL